MRRSGPGTDSGFRESNEVPVAQGAASTAAWLFR